VGTQVFAFVLSFVMVGMYWVAHHNMGTFLKGVDRTLLWLNLILLLTIVFIPFSTAVLGRHLGDSDAVILYGLNLLFVNIAGTAFWLYGGTNSQFASRRHVQCVRVQMGATPCHSKFGVSARSRAGAVAHRSQPVALRTSLVVFHSTKPHY
jgi:hypothetical protein